MASSPCRPGPGPTLRRRVAAIARAHRIAGHPLDTRHPAIRETLRGIARAHGEPPRRAAALTTAEVKRLVRACGNDRAGLRDRALFLIGYAGALRRSELVALDVEHITWADEGLRLLIGRSQTDPAGHGAELGIPRGRSADTCPVFRRVRRWDTPGTERLHPDAVRQILLKRALQAQVGGTLWEPVTPHGLRAGFITAAYKNGVSDEEIMGHSRHRSLATMRSYIRRAKLSSTSPAGKVGL